MDLFDLNEFVEPNTEGLSLVKCPVLVMGVTSDMLFPIWQQREIANKLKQSGKSKLIFKKVVSYFPSYS